jgi:hypothetical protein
LFVLAASYEIRFSENRALVASEWSDSTDAILVEPDMLVEGEPREDLLPEEAGTKVTFIIATDHIRNRII